MVSRFTPFSTGPLDVPIFVAYGLTGGSFLGTEAASSLLLYAGKLAAFGGAGALTADVVLRGLVIGSALLFGSIAARGLVERIDLPTYAFIIDIVLAIGSVTMILAILR